MTKIPTDIQNMYTKKQEENTVSIDEINSFGDKESIRDMVQSIADYDKMLQEKIIFINEDLTKIIPFTRQNLYLMCAQSGAGKSSAAANISYPLWQQKKKVLIIANEEAADDVLMRISCLHHGVAFNDHKKGIMDPATKLRCMKDLPTISQYVKVIDVNYKNGITTSVEGVMDILDTVADKDFSCVLIDYFQLVKRVDANSAVTNSYEALDKLRMYLGRYIKKAVCPIVLFAQLHSVSKRSKDMDTRIKDCPTIIEPSTVVIEIEPNFDELTTSLIIHKDRFGMAGRRLVCSFDKGRYVRLDPQMQTNKKRDQAISDLEDMQSSIDDLQTSLSGGGDVES